MSNEQATGSEQSSAFSVISATIKSSRNVPINVESVLSELIFYENIGKPFVTGYVAIVDNERVVEGLLDIQGAEIFEIKYKRNTGKLGVRTITQRFVIQRIEKIARANEFTQVVLFRLIDEGVYKSGLTNVNKLMEGQPYQIIHTLLTEYLGRDDLQTSAQFNSANKMRVIVPNMTPLQAAEWIRNRATNPNGYPYYLYKTAIDDKYIFADLETLLSSKVINVNNPFTNNQASSSALTTQREMVIDDMDQAEVDDLYSMVRSGVIGSTQQYYDVTTGDYEEINFNINNDVIADIHLLNDKQKRPTIDGNLKFEDVEISNYAARKQSHVSISKPYKEVKGYDEEYVEGGNKNKIKSRALQHLLDKTPIKLVVRGDAFIHGLEDYGVGNSVRVIVRAKEESPTKMKIDRKQSGDYLICATNYILKFDKANASEMVLLCAKIANYQNDTYSPSGGVV